MVVYSPVECTEVNGSYSSSHAGITGRSTVTLQCSVANVDALISSLIGDTFGSSPGVDPHYPDRYCTSAVWSGFGGENGTYDVATGEQVIVPHFTRVVVTYETPPLERRDNPEAQEIMNESIVPSVEYITLDHRLFQWGENGRILHEREAPGKLVLGLTLKRSWRRVLGPLPIELINLPGHCNASAYYSQKLGLTFPAETLMYGAPTINQTLRTDGLQAFNVDTQFTYKKNTWNKFWLSDTQTWERLYRRARLTNPTNPDDESTTPAEPYNSVPTANLAPLLVF